MGGYIEYNVQLHSIYGVLLLYNRVLFGYSIVILVCVRILQPNLVGENSAFC